MGRSKLTLQSRRAPRDGTDGNAVQIDGAGGCTGAEGLVRLQRGSWRSVPSGAGFRGTEGQELEERSSAWCRA